VKVPELGVQVEVDVEALVERIVLGPALTKTDQELITEVAKAAGLMNLVSSSSLLGTPRYV
jgi:hypothetical protein